MIVFTPDDRRMLARAADMTDDLVHSTRGVYAARERLTAAKLDALAQTEGSSLVVTGTRMQAEPWHLFTEILEAELADWVPGASQRLLFRAGAALGIRQPDPARGRRDCGPLRMDHDLMPDMAARLQLWRCTDCCRLYR